MSKKIDSQARGKYTLEFKLEAVRLVKGGQSATVTAKVLGIPNQTLDNWIRLSNKGELKGGRCQASCRPRVSFMRLF